MTDTTPKPITRPQTIADAKAKAVVEHRAAQVANEPANRIGALKTMMDLRASALTALTGNPQRTQQLISLLIGRVSRAPKLLECDPLSLYLAAQQIASMGLSPLEDRKHFYLIPYKNKNLNNRLEAQLRVSYHGLTHLAMRHPDVADVFGDVVYAGEKFTHDRFTGAIQHDAPLRDAVDPKKIVAAYGCVRMRDGRIITRVLNRSQLDARRAKAMDQSFWNAWPEEMAIKTALNALLRGERVPKIDALANAIASGMGEDIRTVEFEDTTPAEEKPVDYSVVPEIAEAAGPTHHGLAVRANELMGEAAVSWEECATWAAKNNGGVIPEALDDCSAVLLAGMVEWLEVQAQAQRQRDDAEDA